MVPQNISVHVETVGGHTSQLIPLEFLAAKSYFLTFPLEVQRAMSLKSIASRSRMMANGDVASMSHISWVKKEPRVGQFD